MEGFSKGADVFRRREEFLNFSHMFKLCETIERPYKVKAWCHGGCRRVTKKPRERLLKRKGHRGGRSWQGRKGTRKEEKLQERNGKDRLTTGEDI